MTLEQVKRKQLNIVVKEDVEGLIRTWAKHLGCTLGEATEFLLKDSPMPVEVSSNWYDDLPSKFRGWLGIPGYLRVTLTYDEWLDLWELDPEAEQYDDPDEYIRMRRGY